MVAPPGNAPGSSAYRADALLLSYGAEKERNEESDMAEAERIELPRPVRVITVFKTGKHASLASLRMELAPPHGSAP